MNEKVQGTLKVQPTKKGKAYTAVYTYEGKEKIMTIHPSAVAFKESDAGDGVAIEIEINPANKGPLRVTIAGKETVAPVTKSPPSKASSGGNWNQNKSSTSGKSYTSFSHKPSSGGEGERGRYDATAPYNFVPFDRALVVQNLPEEQEGESFSGVLYCSLEARTPLLVAGPQHRDEQKKPVERHFLEVEGNKVIPGTSVKGMLRSLVETLSYSRLAPINDKVLPFRNFDSHEYKNHMGTGVDSRVQKAGWVVKKGSTYTLHEVEYRQEKNHSDTAKYALRVPYGWNEKDTVETGKTVSGNREPNVYFFAPIGTAFKEYSLDRTLIRQFREQLSKDQESRLKRRGTDGSLGKPTQVFFITEKNNPEKVYFIGLPRCFRLPYAHTLSECSGNNRNQGLDFATRLFGQAEKNNSFKGKVAVRPVILKEARNGSPYQVTLGQPAPTSVVHYLEQGSDVRLLTTHRDKSSADQRNNPATMTTYNDPVKNLSLRGRKFYWHREPDAVDMPRGNENTDAKLHPVQAGTRGVFEIALNRVSAEELGAILLALELPEGHAHKLGAGKAIGLGSVRITVNRVAVQAQARRYASLAGRFAGHGAETMPPDQKEACKERFRRFMLAQLGNLGCQSHSFEALPAIRTLRHMQDFDRRPDEADTANMPLHPDRNNSNAHRVTYKNQAILSQALDVPRRK